VVTNLLGAAYWLQPCIHIALVAPSAASRRPKGLPFGIPRLRRQTINF
jgi:hypothetical protein